ncbi:ASI1-immunoprecipitated protein 2-like isoform X2 [Silene latifolia]|uniref:ASI1-immunoprecipitated protein 2-like isoform X2 n=1 Tax=Silene latifolia TaxID=37657 RepID=UPI003D770B75
MTDSNIAHSDVTKETHDLLKPENGFSDKNLPATDSSRRSEGNECLNTVTPVANAQEPLLQGQTISHGDGLVSLEELVDVKVCDICGDAGREALLALCSVCSDGAEHTYCMRNKMEKVPENGWMCEECVGMQKPLVQTEAVAGRAVSASNPSFSKELSQPSPRKSSIVPQAGEPRIKYFRKTGSLSGLRRGPSIEMGSASKKRKPEESIHPSKARTSSMKSLYKDKSVAPLVSSFGERPAKRACEPASSSGHRSLISEKRFCRGTPYKRETDDLSKSKVTVQQCKDVLLPRIDTAKENADNKLGKKIPDKKFIKSLSFAGSATSDVPNPQISSIIKSSGLKSGVDRGLTKNVRVPEKKTTRCLSSTRSFSMNVPSSKRKVVLEAAKTMLVLNKAAIQACENIDVKTSDTLAEEGKKIDPLGEKLASSHSSDAISCLNKDANSSPGCRRNHPTLKANLNNSTKDNSHSSAASEKVLRHGLHAVKPMATLAPVKNVSPRSSAVPAAEYIWKGGFKLEKSARLPNYCSGVQAHVSSCASSKIHEVILKFGPKLEFKEVSRSETWRTYFPRNCPTEEDIALYFFAEDMQSYRRSYKVLLDGMMGKDLVLEASFDGIQLLVLPSSLLPVSSQRWNSLFYLWGVCKARKVEDQRPRLAGLDIAKSSLDLCTPVTNRSPSKCISTVEDGSFSPSQTSHNSIQGPDTVQPLRPQSSSLNKSSYKSYYHDTSSIKCLGVLEEIDMKPDTAQSVYDLKEETSFCRALHSDNMLVSSVFTLHGLTSHPDTVQSVYDLTEET